MRPHRLLVGRGHYGNSNLNVVVGVSPKDEMTTKSIGGKRENWSLFSSFNLIKGDVPTDILQNALWVIKVESLTKIA